MDPFAETIRTVGAHQSKDLQIWQKALRKGKVLIDWSQNDEHKTTVNG
jgi:DNA primase